MENIRHIEKTVREACEVVLDRYKTDPDLTQLICDEAAKIVAPYRDPVVTVTVEPETLACNIKVTWDAYDYYMLFGSVGDALD